MANFVLQELPDDMTLSNYSIATGQCRSSASNDLKRMVADADSGITIRGSHSHKVWISSRLLGDPVTRSHPRH